MRKYVFVEVVNRVAVCEIVLECAEAARREETGTYNATRNHSCATNSRRLGAGPRTHFEMRLPRG